MGQSDLLPYRAVIPESFDFATNPVVWSLLTKSTLYGTLFMGFSGTRTITHFSDYAGGLNRSTQHSAQAHLTLKTKVRIAR
jgi:hypothetical protein